MTAAGYGMALDPQTTREQRAAEVAEPPPLNSEFPYKREPFDPFYFGLDKMRLRSDPDRVDSDAV